MKPNAKHDDISLSALARCAREAGVTVRNAEGDSFPDTRYVICAGREGNAYAYCMNYMDSYRLEGTTFRSDLMQDAFSVSFDRYQCYERGLTA